MKFFIYFWMIGFSFLLEPSYGQESPKNPDPEQARQNVKRKNRSDRPRQVFGQQRPKQVPSGKRTSVNVNNPPEYDEKSEMAAKAAKKKRELLEARRRLEEKRAKVEKRRAQARKGKETETSTAKVAATLPGKTKPSKSSGASKPEASKPTKVIEKIESPVSKGPSGSEDQKVSVNFPPQIDLVQFIKIVAAKTNTVFVYDEKKLRGKLSIVAPPDLEMSPEDAYLIFEKLLASQGLTLVRQENSNVVEVLTDRDARFSRLPVRSDDSSDANVKSTESVIRFVRVKHADLNKLKSTLSPIFSKSGVILTYDPLDLLVFIDTKRNVDRVTELMALLDVKESNDQKQQVTLYRMQHNKVEDIHRTTFAIFSNVVRNGRKQKVKFIVEKRMNALVILASKSLTDEIIDFIKQIDIPLDGSGATLTLYELKYTSASAISPVLASIFAQPKLAGAISGRAKKSAKASKKSRKKEKSTSKKKEAGNSGYSTVDTPVKIIAFDRLNSLIIIASPSLTEEILGLARQLDVERGDVQLKLHPLKYASAKVLAPLLSNIFSDKIVAGKGKGSTSSNSRVKIIAEPRLNSLLIIADNFTTQRIINLVDELDVLQGDSEIVLLPLKYSSSKGISTILTQVFSRRTTSNSKKGGSTSQSGVKVLPIERLNAIIVIGDKVAIRQVKELISKIDVERGDIRISLYRLKYASATNVAPLLKQIFSETSSGGKGKAQDTETVQVFAEKRLNALIIIAGKQKTAELKDIIVQLDVPEVDGDSNFKVYTLNYAVASELAKMLKEVTRNIVEVSTSQEKKAQNKNAKGNSNSNRSQPSLDISISTDEATNSLLVFAPTDVFPTLDRIIQKLDVPRPQVYVEALIVEVTLEKSLNFGVDWTTAAPSPSRDSIVTAGNTGSSPLTVESALGATGDAQFGLVSGGALTFNDQKFLSFGAFVKATQSDSEINVLSNPQLLMLNNQQATINVSNVIPVATNSSVDANGRVTDQIDFRDIGVILTIRPQISGKDSIRLEIEETFSNVVPTSTGNSNAVTTLKRELKTTIVTADDSIVVLGGLLTEGANNSESKIPGLGDIPLIGWLFGSSSDAYNKTNLLLFVRPRIVKNYMDLQEVTRRAQLRYNRSNQNVRITRDVLNDMNTFKQLEDINAPDLLPSNQARLDAEASEESKDVPAATETVPAP